MILPLSATDKFGDTRASLKSDSKKGDTRVAVAVCFMEMRKIHFDSEDDPL